MAADLKTAREAAELQQRAEAGGGCHVRAAVASCLLEGDIAADVAAAAEGLLDRLNR